MPMFDIDWENFRLRDPNDPRDNEYYRLRSKIGLGILLFAAVLFFFLWLFPPKGWQESKALKEKARIEAQKKQEIDIKDSIPEKKPEIVKNKK